MSDERPPNHENPPHPDPTTLEASGIFRVIDAAANRAREALRVLEDYVRFVLDDRHLTEQFKRIRHEMAAALAPIDVPRRLAARETQADVGTTLSTETEQSRDRPEAVLTANFCRLQESLRSLEEFVKLVEPRSSSALESLRYRGYTLQRAVDITRRSIERLADARLYVLLDGRATLDEFDRLARELVAAGVDVLQLRDKRLDDRTLLARARRLREITRGTATLFVMNDRPDLALLARADAVHLGQEDLPVKEVRALVGPTMLLGVSVHSLDQARAAVLDGADYLGVGPTFTSGTKSFEHYPGPELLQAVAAEIRLPAFAIGGIHRGNLAQVLATGMTRVAVSGGILDAANPRIAAEELRTALFPGEP
ncbi:MAG TPA: thiamine phosphate synthase [Thermoguttaceae bacterium]|nr:thiamine phosphate synthase [Thermoguttaceae bacterium]